MRRKDIVRAAMRSVANLVCVRPVVSEVGPNFVRLKFGNFKFSAIHHNLSHMTTCAIVLRNIMRSITQGASFRCVRSNGMLILRSLIFCNRISSDKPFNPRPRIVTQAGTDSVSTFYTGASADSGSCRIADHSPVPGASQYQQRDHRLRRLGGRCTTCCGTRKRMGGTGHRIYLGL